MRKSLLKNEVAKMFNTTKETLRHYENLNLIKPEVTNNNYKYYGNEELMILQKILFLRNMDMQLEDIEKVINHTENSEDNIKLMKMHYDNLQKKLQSMQEIYEKVGQLITLMENRQNVFETFQIRTFNERYFYHFPYHSLEVAKSPKLFYDRFKPIVETGIYSEKPFCLIFPYEELNKNENLGWKHCIEINKDQFKEDEHIIALPKGEYLCIYYLFNKGNWSKTNDIRKHIDTFLKDNQISIKNADILEIEHQEFSIVCEEGQSVYELQIPIDRKGH
ncbi:MerR family transcriptional regulator [Cytobacillus spongiae]|uniref:MerR family transcriptional regulator n=1 Tax=Cytobacillus spongiae TaxID=2901381 RepID=UPI001F3BD461|nr:MerR family transcriptional regulator [Cytobacillus spongiae]UII56377.1 MerR family transcriptional regulator [Cytobacillus spongiae]